MPERYERAGVVKESDAPLEMEASGIPRMFVGAEERPYTCAHVQPWSAIVSLLLHVGFCQSLCSSRVGPQLCPLRHCCSLAQSSQFWALP